MERFKIKAFGMLAEKLPSGEFEFPVYGDTRELLDRLEQEFPQLKDAKYTLAVDKQVVHDKQALNGNEEIALLPPFSGG
ncbi:MoaD/ThiS family protein [Antarcticibacterium flavum]|uniref:MoaD/ThiS family protein n=1 Tax=Antarcticibacterium flavum TaxID=2058175 RepID=A0A5B7X410_9FLAO|nr:MULTISPECIES: MoaD/ThiS family protein [Antarcticibacterium]MCM4158293.1 molybdopterin synthase sulfur carrier subunit [Antarcticibacterium sp. W02-3]QCY70059.1 MoaD/ThiS family protein [Antarcticibacterium flavum]